MSDQEQERPETPSLEKRVTQPGRHVGDRYVRIMRPTGSGIRGHGGRYVATEQTMERSGRVGRGFDTALRFLIGKRLHSDAEAVVTGSTSSSGRYRLHVSMMASVVICPDQNRFGSTIANSGGTGSPAWKA